jgi:hypothetical protein
VGFEPGSSVPEARVRITYLTAFKKICGKIGYIVHAPYLDVDKK